MVDMRDKLTEILNERDSLNAIIADKERELDDLKAQQDALRAFHHAMINYIKISEN